MAKKKKAPARRRRPKLKRAKKPSFAGREFIEHMQLKHMRLLDLYSHLAIHDEKLPTRTTIQCNVGVGPSSDGHIHANAVLNVEGRPEGGGDSIMEIKAQYQCV